MQNRNVPRKFPRNMQFPTDHFSAKFALKISAISCLFSFFFLRICLWRSCKICLRSTTHQKPSTKQQMKMADCRPQFLTGNFMEFEFEFKQIILNFLIMNLLFYAYFSTSNSPSSTCSLVLASLSSSSCC